MGLHPELGVVEFFEPGTHFVGTQGFGVFGQGDEGRQIESLGQRDLTQATVTQSVDEFEGSEGVQIVANGLGDGGSRALESPFRSGEHFAGLEGFQQPVRFDFRFCIRFFTHGRLKVPVRIRLGLFLRECGLPDLQVAEDLGMVDLEWVLGSGKSLLDGGAGSEWNTVR